MLFSPLASVHSITNHDKLRTKWDCLVCLKNSQQLGKSSTCSNSSNSCHYGVAKDRRLNMEFWSRHFYCPPPPTPKKSTQNLYFGNNINIFMPISCSSNGDINIIPVPLKTVSTGNWILRILSGDTEYWSESFVKEMWPTTRQKLLIWLARCCFHTYPTKMRGLIMKY